MMKHAMSIVCAAAALAVGANAVVAQEKKPQKMNLIASWGDITLVYGPGTDPAMDTADAMANMFAHWKARGFTGIYLRTDLSTNPPGSIVRWPEKTQTNAMLGLYWRMVDQIMEKSDPHHAASAAAKKVGFEHWMFHPYIYSEGAPADVGKEGPGRMIPWSYARKYHVAHPEVISIDRAGNQLWMVPEYAYEGVRAEKVAEFVHMAKTYKPDGIIASMRSEVSQLIDPPEHGDQYGFNKPVVDEMKRLYNVDIMTDPRFDYKSPSFNIDDPMLNNWRDLRGSYLTALFREIGQGIRKAQPGVKFGVTLSGEHIGPLLGNWRLEWRKWIDEGIVDTIVVPVFFEATLDADADKKGYLTHSRIGKGIVTAAEVKAYIAKSKHPEIEVIHTGAPSYFYPQAPAGSDGWQCDAWYDAYTLASFQRWEQFKKDVVDFGHVKYLEQNFDGFPLSKDGNVQLGEGEMRYDPTLRCSPGGWHKLGNGADGKAVIQTEMHRGDKGSALMLKNEALLAQHFSSPDRGRMTGVLDIAPANGRMHTEMWVRRESETSNTIVAVTGSISYEKDVALRIVPGSGRLDYASGKEWLPTGQIVPVGQWVKLAFDLDIDARTYSAYLGDDAGASACKNIAFAPPADRFVEEHGVNIPIKVPSYRVFNTLSFEPGQQPENKVYLDDVSMNWTPTMHYAQVGSSVLFQETFEKQTVSDQIAGGKGEKGNWTAKADKAETGPSLQLQRTTSYGVGAKSLRVNAPATLAADLGKLPAAGQAMTVDLDVFIRSDKNFPYIMPDPTTKSSQGTVIGVYATGTDKPIIAADSAKGTWQLWDGTKYVDTGKLVTYDVWSHVQLAIDPAAKTCQLVAQPIGSLPELIGTVTLPDTTALASQLSLKVQATSAKPANPISYDNIIVTTK